MRCQFLVLGFVAAVVTSGCNKPRASVGADTMVWSTTQEWSAAKEAEFGKFIQRIGDARWAHNLRSRPADLAAWKSLIGYDPGSCVFLKDCIKNAQVNPYYTVADNALTIEADCGDVPATVRGYFAFKNRLPFIYNIAMHEPPGGLVGIFPPASVVNQKGLGTMNALFGEIRDGVHAHFYRTPVGVEHTDTYLARIDRDTIRPGTVVYDLRGHVMMVFRIKPDGTPLVIQGHPGPKSGKPPSYFTVTSIDETTLPQDFGYKSGGFRNWRPYIRSNQTSYTNNGEGQITKVRYLETEGYVFAPDKSLPDLDTAGTNFQRSYRLSDGSVVGYHEYIKEKLCTSQCGKHEPDEIRTMLFQVCTDILERQKKIDSANSSGLTRAKHPGVPANIYETGEPWESQSTPGFDGRLRASYVQIVQKMRKIANIVATKSGGTSFSGSQAELANVFQGYFDEVVASPACQISAVGSTGNYSVNAKTVNEKLSDMSFDPYHCPELRWGVKANCGAEQQKFYAEEARVRNIFDGTRPAAGGMSASGIPLQLERAPAAAPARSEYNIQDAINQLRGGSTYVPPKTPVAPVEQPAAQQPAVQQPTAEQPQTQPTAASNSGSSDSAACARYNAKGSMLCQFSGACKYVNGVCSPK